MRVFGLTGGIGCGKSTVAALFAQRRVPVIDADRVSRDVVAPGSAGLAEVLARFGTDLLASDGTLDRKRLGARVFADPALRAELQSIVIPRIAEESMRRFAALSARGARWGLYEASLLVENETHRTLAGLLVVTARPDVQIARTMARDGLDAPAARARIDAQLPMALKIAEADWVVDNSGERARLEARAAEVYATIVLREGPPVEGSLAGEPSGA